MPAVSLRSRGYLIWWKRRPTRSDKLACAPPRHGALRTAARWGVAAVIAAGILIGWCLPFIGYTIVGFVVIDTAIGWVGSRRAKHSPTSAG